MTYKSEVPLGWRHITDASPIASAVFEQYLLASTQRMQVLAFFAQIQSVAAAAAVASLLCCVDAWLRAIVLFCVRATELQGRI